MEVEVDLLADCMPRAGLGHSPLCRGGGLRCRRNRGSQTRTLAAAPPSRAPRTRRPRRTRE
eukprot:6190311-Heterocapsa_arctica.AAC.1